MLLQVALMLQEEGRERRPEEEPLHLEEASRVTGLGCHSNRSLSFLLADSGTHGSLLQALGLEEGWRGAVLVSPQVLLLLLLLLLLPSYHPTFSYPPWQR